MEKTERWFYYGMNEQEKKDYMIEKAKAFAHEAHDRIKQVRKYTKEPYWVHTDAVAALVATTPNVTTDMIVAAHLHDILEDVTPIYPGYSEGQIEVQFGKPVLALVKELTDEFTKEKYPKMNRVERKANERERIGKASVAAKTIKLADLINNTESIVAHDKDFAKVYLAEKLALLPYLSDGDSALLNRAAMQTVAAYATLGLPMPVFSA